jgi:hypothetical protein
MDEIRRQNDVERWRNKLRLQEKFQVNYKKHLIKKKSVFLLQHSSIEIHDSSAPSKFFRLIK